MKSSYIPFFYPLSLFIIFCNLYFICNGTRGEVREVRLKQLILKRFNISIQGMSIKRTEKCVFLSARFTLYSAQKAQYKHIGYQNFYRFWPHPRKSMLVQKRTINDIISYSFLLLPERKSDKAQYQLCVHIDVRNEISPATAVSFRQNKISNPQTWMYQPYVR